MIYTINVKISKVVDLNFGEIAKNGQPLAADLAKAPNLHKVFDHRSSVELTASQIREIIVNKLCLPANITDEVMKSNGKKVKDSDVVKSYNVVYTATLPNAEGADQSQTAPTTTQAVVETTTQAVVETTTQAVVETTTEAVVETTTEAVVETTTQPAE